MLCGCLGGVSRSASRATTTARPTRPLVRKLLGHTFVTRLRALDGTNYYQEAPSLMSPASLEARLRDAKAETAPLHVLDCTWYLPNAGRSGSEEFKTLGRLQGAKFFDLDAIADKSTTLPHMLPSEGAFGAAMDALGISPDDEVIVYDRQGVFSAPRAWWTFLAMGHVGAVSVLNGGLPEWESVLGAGYMIETGAVETSGPGEACQNHKPGDTGAYKASLRGDLVKSLEQVVATYEQDTGEIVVDARPAGRWQGRAPEPRQGLPSGHVPGSKNIPWDAVLDTLELEGDGTSVSYKRFKSEDGIRQVLADSGLEANSTDFSNVIASCGSGTTACILVLASEQLQVCDLSFCHLFLPCAPQLTTATS